MVRESEAARTAMLSGMNSLLLLVVMACMSVISGIIAFNQFSIIPMTIVVKCFASLRDDIGIDQTRVNAADSKDVATVWAAITDQPMDQNVLCAINHQYVERDHPVSDGDELAFFPPVTGG